MSDPRGSAWRAHLLTRGSRSALLCPSEASVAGEETLAHAIARDLIARSGQRADLAVRSIKVSSKQLAPEDLALELRADYAVRIDAEASEERLSVALTMTPTSRELPAHQERFEAPAGERIRFVDETAAHVFDDLLTLLDEQALRGMREWDTKNVHAYRSALSGLAVRRVASVYALESCAEHFMSALAEDPRLRVAYRNLTEIYHDMALVAGTTRYRERVRGNLRQLITRATEQELDRDAIAAMNHMLNLLTAANPIEAEERWRAELVENPANAEALRSYENLLVGAGFPDEAERYLARALELHPQERDEIQQDYATIAGARGDFEEHLRVIKRTLEFVPDFMLDLYGAVELHAWLGRFAEAKLYLARLHAADRHGGFAHAAKLSLMAMRGDLALGSAGLDEALSRQPIGNMVRGRVCFILGDVERGCRYWREVESGLAPSLWRFKALAEHYWKPGVVQDPRYQDMLDYLGIGHRWKVYLWDRARELTAITGIPVTTSRPVRPSPPVSVGRTLSAVEAAQANRVALDLVPYAVMVLDAGGHVVSKNAAAQRLLERRKGLKTIGDRLTADDPSAARELKEAIDRVSAAKGDVSPLLVRCPRPVPAAALHVLVSPIAPGSDMRRPDGMEPHATSLVLASDPDAAPVPAADALQQLFDLTPTLSRLAAAIAAGRTVSEYAENHEVTEGTARQQLKELMARVGVRRQAELVRVLLSGVAQLRTETQA